MRLTLTIKILLAICCIYFPLHIIYVNTKINNSIKEKYTILSSLRKNPTPDTAVNLKRYLTKKSEIDNEVLILQKNMYPGWARFIAAILPFIGGFLIRDIWGIIFKKKRLTE